MMRKLNMSPIVCVKMGFLENIQFTSSLDK